MGPDLWLAEDGNFSPSGTSQPPRALPHTYLYFIKELGIQQGQLFSDFMAVEVVQGPRPGRQTPEVNGQGQLELSGLGARAGGSDRLDPGAGPVSCHCWRGLQVPCEPMYSSAARERRAQEDRGGAIGTQVETVTNKHLWLG